MDQITQGAYANGLFAITCPDCLKDSICFPCIASPAINEKLGSPLPNIAAMAGPLFGFAACVLYKYGTEMKGKDEDPTSAAVKALYCGPCYMHQLMKEPVSPGLAGAPAQTEMA